MKATASSSWTKRALFTLLIALGTIPIGGAQAADFGVRIGIFFAGKNDAITDVPGVRLAHLTKIEGAAGPLQPGIGPVRTGATAIIPNDDIWNKRVAAATYDLNGNGELSGAHWVDESGFLEVPIVLTNTLNVGRVDDGVVSWMIKEHPAIGIRDDVPLPVVAECDDQALNDIQGRHVSANDVVKLLDSARPGQFARGSVGAGTGMRAFGFKAGIGSASRLIVGKSSTYTVGVLVNVNTGSRQELRINGVHVGEKLAHELLPVFPKKAAFEPTHGRAADGSIIIVIATNAPLDGGQLRRVAKRAALGLARTGATSHTSSGDLFIAFSTAITYPRNNEHDLLLPVARLDDDALDPIFSATVEATEVAIYDALFSARTMSGAHNITFYGLPVDRVRGMLRAQK